MSLYHCALTGEPIENPVVSKLTGHVFESRIIQKHLEATGTCPISHTPMQESDLVELKVSKSIKPRPVNSASLPNIMTIMQNEWDTILLENYQLKESLNAARQELSHALYQHDAACRVIARLIRERDEARENLSKLTSDLKAQQQMDIEETNNSVLAPELNQKISDTSLALNADRKRRRKDKEYSEKFPSKEIISSYCQSFETSLHSATSAIVGISLSPSNSSVVASGGKDGSTVLFDLSEKTTMATSAGNKKCITDISFCHENPNAFVVSSEDKSVKLFKFTEGNKKLEKSYTHSHNSVVKSCEVHPCDLLFASCESGDWSIHDLNKGSMICNQNLISSANQFSNVLRIHPDGHVVGAGMSDGKVQIYSIGENSVVANLEGHSDIVTQLAFSGNGYHLASASSDGIVKIWDLRNLQCLGNLLEGENLKLGALAFDSIGQFLAVGGLDLNLFNVKSLESVAKFSSNKDLITGIAFGEFSSNIVTGALDRQLIVYSNK